MSDFKDINYNELLSESECETILWNALKTKLKILNYEVVPVENDIIGFLGEYFKLHILTENRNGEHKNHTFFIKSNAIKDEILHAVVEELGAFRKEKSFYGELFRDMKDFSAQKWHPDCYYVRSDIIVMEDLFLASYKHLPDKFPLNNVQIKSILKSMAAMHGNMITFEVKTETDVKEKYPNLQHEYSMVNGEGWWHAGLKSIKSVAKVHPKFKTVEYQNQMDNKMENAINMLYEVVKPSTKFQNTFCHRDAWGKNIFFKFENGYQSKPKECILVDFQSCRYLPPAVDVLIFIYLNTRRALREKNIDEWLRCYYEHLTEITKKMGVDLEKYISWKNFLESCDSMKIVALVLMAIYIPTTNASEDVALLKETDPQQFEYYMKHDRSNVILEKLRRDEPYRNYVFEAVEELIDYIFSLKL